MWPPARGPSMASDKKIEGVWSKGEDPGGDPDRHRVIRAARQWPGQSTATQTPQWRGIGRVDPKGGGGISNLQSPYHETNRRNGDGPLDCGCGWPPPFFFVFSCRPRGGRDARAAAHLGTARRGARGVCTGGFLFPRGPRGGTANARGARAGPWGGGSPGRRPRQDSCRIAAGRSWPAAAGGHPPAGKPPRLDRRTACAAINAAASPARIAPPGAACGSSAVQAQADAGLWRGPR